MNDRDQPISGSVNYAPVSCSAAPASSSSSSSWLFSSSRYATLRMKYRWLPRFSICLVLCFIVIVGCIVIPVAITQTRNQTSTASSSTPVTSTHTSSESSTNPNPNPSTPIPTPTGVPQPNRTPIQERPVIRHIYPHDPSAFTQGLQYYENNTLFESTGLWGESTARIVNLTSGQVLKNIRLADREYFGEGLTLLGDLIYQITWRNKIGFIYNLSLAQIGQFPITTDGWGLTSNGSSLILSDGSNQLYWIDPQTFSIIQTISVTRFDGNNRVNVTQINELEYIQGYVYANVWFTDVVVVIDPSTGNVVKEIILDQVRTAVGVTLQAVQEGNTCNGIAYDPIGGRMFFTGKKWPALVECDVILPTTRAARRRRN